MAMALGGSTVIDVESLAASMESKMGKNQVSLSPKNCIFRTPSTLARHHPNAYIPEHFSFGPFHHNPEKFKVTEEIKIKYLKGLLSRSDNPEVLLRECLNSIKEVETKARNCYAENLDHLSEDQFLEMLVLDGCFIIELFRKSDNALLVENDDPTASMACMTEFLVHDLMLLENQIPWLVLELLFEKTKSPDIETKSLLELALQLVQGLLLFDPCPDPSLFVNIKINHILDLLRLFLVLPSEQVQEYLSRESNEQNYLELRPIPSATRLEEAGVKFVKVARNSILDVKFRNGFLEIPFLMIQGRTDALFRNLISYEQSLPDCKTIFTSYAMVMDSLIDTTNDIEILCKKGILGNWIGPENATKLLDKLSDDITTVEVVYDKLCNEINSHCQRWWPRWRAAYVHNYFGKPWAIAAQIYAIVIFVLTFWQAYKSG